MVIIPAVAAMVAFIGGKAWAWGGLCRVGKAKLVGVGALVLGSRGGWGLVRVGRRGTGLAGRGGRRARAWRRGLPACWREAGLVRMPGVAAVGQAAALGPVTDFLPALRRSPCYRRSVQTGRDGLTASAPRHNLTPSSYPRQPAPYARAD